jgi:hypothetical protein
MQGCKVPCRSIQCWILEAAPVTALRSVFVKILDQVYCFLIIPMRLFFPRRFSW